VVISPAQHSELARPMECDRNLHRTGHAGKLERPASSGEGRLVLDSWRSRWRCSLRRPGCEAQTGAGQGGRGARGGRSWDRGAEADWYAASKKKVNGQRAA